MKFVAKLFGLAACALALTGCEWSSGGGAETWNDSGNWVDFSGTYRSSDNGILVRAFGADSSTTTNSISSTNIVAGEYLGSGDGVKTAFEGHLEGKPARGSLTIFTIGGYRFTDSASGSEDTVSLSVQPNDGSTGRFNYSTRAWALTFPAPLANGTDILASYQAVSLEDDISSNQGNHGKAIYSFVILQTGNKLQITDSNGARYEGTIGTVRTTGGTPINANDASFVQPTTGSVVAQFTATGISQGFKVTLVGVLQGTLSGANMLSGRNMQATFIEHGGYEGNVNAVAQ